jgi:hypothetical protein
MTDARIRELAFSARRSALLAVLFPFARDGRCPCVDQMETEVWMSEFVNYIEERTGGEYQVEWEWDE